jgi:hypothetical protein
METFFITLAVIAKQRPDLILMGGKADMVQHGADVR